MITTSKRKLSAPEYRSVDEDYRVAMIKYETTQMAVKDLEKYHKALDKVRASDPYVLICILLAARRL